MFQDFNVPYAVTGGVALQLYSTEPRNTIDLDFVSPRSGFKAIVEAQPWANYGLELELDRRRYLKLWHVKSRVRIDINVDTRFLPLLESTVVEHVEGHPIHFVTLTSLAVAKLRTQRSDWPRDPAKRLQDRTDLMKMLQAHPEMAGALRDHELTNDEMRGILDSMIEELARPYSDELPPPDDEADE
jgi:hypothetical protein